MTFGRLVIARWHKYAQLGKFFRFYNGRDAVNIGIGRCFIAWVKKER